MTTHECLKGTKFLWSYCSLFCFLFFVVVFFLSLWKRNETQVCCSRLWQFTLISVTVVHYNCVTFVVSSFALKKKNFLFWEDAQSKFQYWHLTSFQYRTPTTRWTSGKHYLIILKTSERLLFPRHKRYSNEGNTNYVELLLESGFLFNDGILYRFVHWNSFAILELVPKSVGRWLITGNVQTK